MWGSSYLFIKIAVDTVPTFTLISLRLLIGAAFLWIAFRISGLQLPRERRLYGHFVVMALAQRRPAVHLITWAEQSVDSALASVLNATVPLFVLVIAPMFLPDEPIRVNGIVGLAVGFAGVVLIVSPGLMGSGGDPLGALALLGSSLTYAVGNVYNRRNVRGLAAAPAGPVPGDLRPAHGRGAGDHPRATVGDGPARRRGLVQPHLARDLRLRARLPALLPTAVERGARRGPRSWPTCCRSWASSSAWPSSRSRSASS